MRRGIEYRLKRRSAVTKRLLDLFCGAGGAGMGYHRAGFEVVGVDNRPQPRYPFEFHQADALEFCRQHGHEFDAIHASPPCQAYSGLRGLGKQSHRPQVRLIGPMRDALRAAGRPFVIENVVGAPLESPVVLCGQFFGLEVRRHRLFECSFRVDQPDCRAFHKPRPMAVYGDHPERHTYKPGSGGYINRAHTLADGQRGMGIDWMDWRELTQAIPPAYTEFIGKQLIRALCRPELRYDDARRPFSEDCSAGVRPCKLRIPTERE